MALPHSFKTAVTLGVVVALVLVGEALAAAGALAAPPGGDGHAPTRKRFHQLHNWQTALSNARVRYLADS
jgi:hypothetical protein